MLSSQKGFAPIFILVVIAIVVGAGVLYFLSEEKDNYESRYKVDSKPSYEESSEKQNLAKLKEESKFKKDNEIQLKCFIIKPHQGETTFNLEVYITDPSKLPVKAIILDTGRVLKELDLKGPYDSITSPGDKVYSASSQANQNYESKEVMLQLEDNKQTISITKRLGRCTQGIE